MSFGLFKKKKNKNDSVEKSDTSLSFINETVEKIQSTTDSSNDKPTLEIQKPKKKSVLSIVLIVIASLMYACIIAGIITIAVLLKDKPELNVNDIKSPDSSTIYDRDGEVIAEVGYIIRKNVTYDELPTSLIDAFLAVEDSRFFEHGGFDTPRFVKALIDNIKTRSFGQGGSTFTMQLIKNTYFVDDKAGVGAAKSIKRKVQEIALALELEHNPDITKEDIFVAYLNKLFFGGTYQNIRGVQKASEYYFGKPVNELSLSESALLAGVINAPNLYNPYNNLDYAQQRRDEVLQMMLYHGYISEAEYNAAVKTKVIDLLSDDSFSKRGVGEGDPYQAFIDEVVDEVYELTGQDPYTTSMKIYTTMDKVVQTRMDEIQAEVVDEKYYYKDKDGNPYFFPDDKFEIASICVDNKTGEIYGILGGRNYADGGALLLNHATQQKKQPGSAIKPILDYSQAFEVLGWSTSHYVVDEPITYPGTQIHIGNSNGYFQGIMPLKTAVYESLNTPAISTLWEIMQHEQGGNEYLANYMNSIGFNIDPAKFEIQYGIGGSSLNVSCLQMAGAQAMLINLGEYNKPHTITKIEYPNDKAPFIYKSNPVQAISPQAAYLTTELLKFNVSGDATNAEGEHYANLMELFRDNYQIYAKTGTSNWDSSARSYGIPNGVIKDGWTIASTSKVTIATWIGYEKAEKEDDKVYGYITYPVYNRNLKGKITRMIVNTTVEEFGKPEDVEEPEGIVEISHVAVPGKPYLSLFDGVPEDKIASGLIKESAYELEEGSYTAMEERINSAYHPEYEEEQEW